jgi:hypothetical protein
MTVQSPFLDHDQFLTRAIGKVPDTREITALPFCLQEFFHDRLVQASPIDTSTQERFCRLLSFYSRGLSGVTKSRTTSASSFAFASTSRAVMASALPSLIARSCLRVTMLLA